MSVRGHIQEREMMIVQPELVDHPKFRRLKRLVGPLALEYLVRLWGHCQAGQRGGFWPGKTRGYVEDVAGWMGDSGVLAQALAEPYEGGSPWVVFEGDGIRIHDWEEMNSTLIFAWRNGAKGGRRSKPAGNPAVNPRVNPAVNRQVTHGEPMGDPIRVERRGEEESTDARGGLDSGSEADLGQKGAAVAGVHAVSPHPGPLPRGEGGAAAGSGVPDDAQIPSLTEVIEEGKMRCVPGDYCAHFHATHEADRLWLNAHGVLKDWRKRLRSWWVKDQATWKNPRGKNGAVEAQREVLERLEAALQVEQRPEALAEIRRQIKEAKG